MFIISEKNVHKLWDFHLKNGVHLNSTLNHVVKRKLKNGNINWRRYVLPALNRADPKLLPKFKHTLFTNIFSKRNLKVKLQLIQEQVSCNSLRSEIKLIPWRSQFFVHIDAWSKILSGKCDPKAAIERWQISVEATNIQQFLIVKTKVAQTLLEQLQK